MKTNNVEDFNYQKFKKNSTFQGFVIANESEEFLAHFDEKENFYIRKAWAKTPLLALRYKTLPEAVVIFDKVKVDVSYKVWILELLETKDNLILATDADDRPAWL